MKCPKCKREMSKVDYSNYINPTTKWRDGIPTTSQNDYIDSWRCTAWDCHNEHDTACYLQLKQGLYLWDYQTKLWAPVVSPRKLNSRGKPYIGGYAKQ